MDGGVVCFEQIHDRKILYFKWWSFQYKFFIKSTVCNNNTIKTGTCFEQSLPLSCEWYTDAEMRISYSIFLIWFMHWCEGIWKYEKNKFGNAQKHQPRNQSYDYLVIITFHCTDLISSKKIVLKYQDITIKAQRSFNWQTVTFN